MNAKHLTRRQFLSMCGLAVTGTALAACGQTASQPAAAVTAQPTSGPTAQPATAVTAQPTSGPTAEPTTAAVVPPATATPPAASKGGVTLRFWDGWGGAAETNAWNAITALDEFKEAMGDNQLERKENSGGDAALTTAVAGGDPPDTASNFQYLDFMARDMCLPLEPYVSVSSTVKQADFFEESWKEGFYKGTQYGVPCYEGFFAFGLFYNGALVEKAGLDPNQPPLTWTDALEWCKKLTVFDSAGNPTIVGLSPYTTEGEGPWTSDGWMVPTSWGWDWFDESTGKFDLNNDKMIDSLNTLKQFVQFIGPDKIGAFYNVSGHDSWGGAMAAGIEVASIQGYWIAGMMAAMAPEISKNCKASWLPVPESRRGVKVQGQRGHLFTIFKGSKNPGLAFKLCEVLQSKPALDAYFKAEGFLPSRPAYVSAVDTSAAPGLDFYVRSITETTEWHRPLKCEITSYVHDQYVALYDQVNRGKMDAKEAAAELQKRCETEYKNQGFAS
jgi:multiple sugar transport system substrate-binding protein